MDELLFTPYQILFEKPGEGGSGGGGSDESFQESAVAENNASISKITKDINKGPDGEGDKKDPMTRHIGYFEQDIYPELAEGDEPGEGEGGSGQGEEPGEEPPKGKTIMEADDGEGEGEEPPAGEGEQPGEEPAKGEAPEGKQDFFYVPERDAEGRDPYPNDYQTRMDAQFAVAEKVDTFNDYKQELEEAGASIGAAVDPDVVSKIDKYQNLDYASEVDDDQLRADIVDMDEGLKAVKMKVDRVKTRAEKKQNTKKAEKQYIKAEKQAKQASKALGVDKRVGELPEDANKEDLMELVDEQIQAQVADIDQQIQDHANDEEFLQKNSLEAYNRRMDELKQKKQDALSELNSYKADIDNWWEAQIDYRAAKDESTEMTEAEKAQAIDDAYFEFEEDRSQGPNALDLFTKSKDVKPINHFRQFALSPENRKKFDLTNPQGWMKAYKAWQSWVNENVKRKKSSGQKSKSEGSKRSSKAKKPIPEPSWRENYQGIPKGSPMDGLREVNADISKLAHGIMKGS